MSSKPKITNVLALDCEMVGGPGGRSLLGYVAICNEEEKCVYTSFVKQSDVLDYRTAITGLNEQKLKCGREYERVQREVAQIIRGKILVGHVLHYDLEALGLTHPEDMKRDTAFYFRNEKGELPALKDLARQHLGLTIQDGPHNAAKDAKATMRLYKKFQQEIDKEASK